MIARLPVTEALAALVATATGHPCGHGDVPRDAQGAVEDLPYYVLHPLTAVPEGAPMADASEDICLWYQFTCVGGNTAQAERLGDRIREAVLGRDPATRAWLHALDVAGARCYSRSVDVDAGTESDPGAAIVSYVIRFRLDFTSVT